MGRCFKLMAYENTKCSPGDVENFIELSANLIKIVAKYVKKCRWIPVEEKLPEEDEYVLMSFENFSLPMIGRYRKIMMVVEHGISVMMMDVILASARTYL